VRTGRSSGLGKLTEEVRALVPEQTSEALTALATLAGVPRAEYVRDVLIGFVHGHLTLLRLRQSRDPSSAADTPE
jgi:hypothetical protein